MLVSVRMQVFVENVDLDALDEARAQDEELMDEGLRRSNETLDELKKQVISLLQLPFE